MRLARHAGRLLKEVGGYAWQNKAWWIVPVVVVMMFLSVVVVAGSSIAPFIYAIF